MVIRLSVSAGPLSLGSPDPVKTLPSKSGEKETRIGLPKNRTESPVEIPRPPAKTCSDTKSRSNLITSANDFPKEVEISANSP